MEIDVNFMSPEAAELDKIQYEYDVIFVVAGTNKKKNSSVDKIGAPVDSLNSLVVTLKEMNGKNRIDDFIKMCMMRGWVVTKLDVQMQVDVYAKAEEEVIFE